MKTALILDPWRSALHALEGEKDEEVGAAGRIREGKVVKGEAVRHVRRYRMVWRNLQGPFELNFDARTRNPKLPICIHPEDVRKVKAKVGANGVTNCLPERVKWVWNDEQKTETNKVERKTPKRKRLLHRLEEKLSWRW